MPESEQEKRTEQLIPQVVEATIGIRNLRTFKIYPLSMADQLKLTDVITKALQEFMDAGNLEDMAFVGAFIVILRDNIGKIISMVSDEDGEKLLSEMTNEQALTVAEIIFDMNYGVLEKNLKSLGEKARKLFPSARRSPRSFSVTEDTGSKTSSSSPTETEELQ
jgi:hypothetical protein